MAATPEGGYCRPCAHGLPTRSQGVTGTGQAPQQGRTASGVRDVCVSDGTSTLVTRLGWGLPGFSTAVFPMINKHLGEECEPVQESCCRSLFALSTVQPPVVLKAAITAVVFGVTSGLCRPTFLTWNSSVRRSGPSPPGVYVFCDFFMSAGICGYLYYACVIIQFYHRSPSSKRSESGHGKSLQVGSWVLSTAPISSKHFLVSWFHEMHLASISSQRIPAFIVYWETVLKSQDLGAGRGC